MYNVNSVIRHIRQNKKKILIIIGAFVGVAIMVQVLNGFAKESLENSKTTNENNNTNSNTSTVYQPNKTIMSNTVIKESTAKDNTEIIDKFIQYCKNGNIEEAYNLLTPECKEKYYSSVETFEDDYCKSIFSDKENYNIQSWMNYMDTYTYKVRFTENLLATGKSNSDTIQDYITIVNTENGLKLNINSFVLREKIEKKVKNNNINIEVTYKDINIEKEEYLISVTNNTNTDIMLDSLETTEGISLFGSNTEATYQAITNELGKYDVTVPSGNTKYIKVKFYKQYNPRRTSNKIIFSDIILDIEKYKTNPNDEENKTSMVVEF